MRDLPENLYLEKNGIVYDLDKLGFIERPFNLRNKFGWTLSIAKDEQPIFFCRRRKRMSGSKQVVDYIYRFCVGKILNNGNKEKHWLSPEGLYIEPNLEP